MGHFMWEAGAQWDRARWTGGISLFVMEWGRRRGSGIGGGEEGVERRGRSEQGGREEGVGRRGRGDG